MDRKRLTEDCGMRIAVPPPGLWAPVFACILIDLQNLTVRSIIDDGRKLHKSCIKTQENSLYAQPWPIIFSS